MAEKRYKVPHQSLCGQPLFGEVSAAIRSANKRQLQPEDCPEPPASDASAKQFETMQILWKEEMQRAFHDKVAHELLSAPPIDPKKAPQPASLQSVVWRMAQQPFWASAFLHGIHVVLQFAGPLMLNLILQLVASIQKCDTETVEKVLGQEDKLADKCVRDVIWRGYLFCGILFVSKLVEALAVCHQQMIMTRLALNVRSGMICTIYHKCLRLSGLSDSSTGQITNLMSNDTQFLVMLAPSANMIWAAPIQILAAFTLLGLLLGPSFLAGVLVIFLFVPLQKKLATTLFVLRKQVLTLTDERVKLVNEVIQGIRVVKLYAWEDSLRKKMDTVRRPNASPTRTVALTLTRILTATLILTLTLTATPTLALALTRCGRASSRSSAGSAPSAPPSV
jgi:ABC-type multidrug transport system fused ATPase/permease subunit|tara:strand:+ start:33 stop:1211 length:1179 start_codon:yes stop_codon:yes gene_type:complete